MDRLDQDIVRIEQVPPPREDGESDLTVLEVGWTARELLAAPDCWVSAAQTDLHVVVAQGSHLALTRSERLLDVLPPDRTLLVVLGATVREIHRCIPILGAGVGHLWHEQAVIAVKGASRSWPQHGETFGTPRWLRAVGALVLDRLSADHPFT